MKSTHFYPMTGGLVIDTQRQASLEKPITEIPPPPYLRFQMKHTKLMYRPLVRQGQTVTQNQQIAEAYKPDWPTPQYLHTGISGVVVRADLQEIQIKTSVIETTGSAHQRATRLTQNPITIDSIDSLQECLRTQGILGLGGAAFPTHNKINAPHTLIINGVECEPMLTADACLMTHNADQIFKSLLSLHQLLEFRQIYFAIEDDKTRAIQVIQNALETLTQDAPKIELCILPTRYPAGGERQLFEQLFGVRLPPKTKLSERGILSVNVQTLATIGPALQGQPLTHRIVTVTGDCIPRPVNAYLPIGTPLHWIIECLARKPRASDHAYDIRHGGPLMGEKMDHNNSVTAGTSALIVQNKTPTQSAMPCIHCALCEPVCPEALQPQALIQFTSLPLDAQSAGDEKLDQLNLDACIGCGVCDLVCPSFIPLGAIFRAEKKRRQINHDKEQRAAIARHKHQAKLARLAQPLKPNPLKPNPQKLKQQLKQPLDKLPTQKPAGGVKLKTNLARAQRLFREASAALAQAQKKQLDAATLASFQARVNTMRDKAEAAAKLLEANQQQP